MKGSEILFLSQEDVKNCGGFDMSNIISIMESVFKLHHKKDYILPKKTALRWGDMESESISGRINSMPGHIGGDFNISGIKWISSAPQNPFKFNLPRAAGLIILNDPDTLVPIAIMDGTLISAMRTGANSGVAAKYLAKPNSKIMGFIGAGVQNRTQLLALKTVLKEIEEIRIYDLSEERARTFAEEMQSEVSAPILVMDSAEQTVRDSDVFVTATVTKTPIVKSDWVKEGSLYIHVGSHECEFDVIYQSDKIVVDDWEELKHRGVETISIMYNTGVFDETTIYSELGAIVSGDKPGRENDKEKAYFNSVGMGIEDVAVAKAIYENARNNHIGQSLSLWNSPTFI
ncbi:ornithine cyclodeaminase family protein [Metabacillus arenae]|uniref:Ornithine cyclodeaminase n=1 Tax=Metabacillus arenae TaxID=2771434 RepID=A0A926S076_9BACI|nr:ornithine cyclodeaminase family protein [Metabacillus arenae]MBD1382982.1 ornithine cyclodeaminase [Metabacillus arenae]